MKRSGEEYVLLTLCAGGAIGILPFALMRFFKAEWALVIVDSILVTGLFILWLYVFLRRETHIASLFLSLFALSGAIAVVYLKGAELAYWTYPTMVGVYYIIAPRIALLFNLLTFVIITPILLAELEISLFITVTTTIMTTNLFAFVFAMRMSEQREQLMLLATHDPLTGAGNRRALDDKLENVIAAGRRTGSVASLILLDLDHFKRINDNYGHALGDQILIRVTEIIKSRIRITDTLYRFGGEEFVVVADGAPLAAAAKLAENLRMLIEASELIADETVTISLGVAELLQGESSGNWLHRGDEALYKAKRSGRNRSCLAQIAAASTAKDIFSVADIQ